MSDPMPPTAGGPSGEYRAVCVFSRRPGEPQCDAPATVHILSDTEQYGEVAFAACDQHARIAGLRPGARRRSGRGGLAASDILDLIDNATEELCACGCGVRLDPAGASGWWATEACQARWQRRGTLMLETEWPPTGPMLLGPGRVFAAPAGHEPDATGWTEIGATTGDYVAEWSTAIRQLAEETFEATRRQAMPHPPNLLGIQVHESPWVPEGTAYLFNPAAFQQHAPRLEMNPVVIKGVGPARKRPPRWRCELRWLTPKVKVSGQWVRGRRSPIDYGNRGGDLVVEWFGRWQRFALYVGSPPGSHIGFWRTRVDTMRGVNLRIGRRYTGPCLTVFVHTRPSRREQ
jgi:hypothetical protein